MPITTRSGLRKSAIAEPSRRNSGLLTTLMGWSARAWRRMTDEIISPVSTGTVDFDTTIFGPSSASPIARATACTRLTSACPSARIGVPTAMNTISLARTASATSVVKRSRPACTLRAIISPSDGSKNGTSPARSCAIFAASSSTQTTTLPSSEKHVPVTRPTYPEPTIAMRLIPAA